MSIKLPNIHKPSSVSKISTIASTEGLISDAIIVIASEIGKFRTKTANGRSLDLAEARVLQGYIKSLIELSRENREREKDEDLSKLSTEQLLQLATAALAKMPEIKNE